MGTLLRSEIQDDDIGIHPPDPPLRTLIIESSYVFGHSERPRRLSPLSLNFFSSALHGSHVDPYFLRSRVSSSRCSFYKNQKAISGVAYRTKLGAAGKA